MTLDEQALSPALGLDTGTLRGDLPGRRIDEVAQHLPPDHGIAAEPRMSPADAPPASPGSSRNSRLRSCVG